MPSVQRIDGPSQDEPHDMGRPTSPAEFFRSDQPELQKRVMRARERVLDVIRFTSTPLSGRGTCHEIQVRGGHLDDASIEQLTDYVDRIDGQRAHRARWVRQTAEHSDIAPSRRWRSPQDVKRRRSALFGGKDVPPGYFGRRVSQREIDRFVDLMRWCLIEEAIRVMHAQHELVLVGDVWYVPVSVMDGHRRRRQAHRPGFRVKYDDRSHHGETNTARRRHLRVAA